MRCVLPVLISIHALLAESDVYVYFLGSDGWISIHALLAESDSHRKRCRHIHIISIHALLAESDSRSISLNFQLGNFYPRSPCGERRASDRRVGNQRDFYPRSPCGERRRVGLGEILEEVFLSTLSLRRATSRHKAKEALEKISIHALLAESDYFLFYGDDLTFAFLSTLSLRRATLHCKTPITFRHYFYPRSPCGERRKE